MTISSTIRTSSSGGVLQCAAWSSSRHVTPCSAAQIASALLTWAVVLLAPASLIIALIARPLA